MEVLDIAAFLREKHIPFELTGNAHEPITGYSSLYRCKPGTLVWARDRATFLGRGNPEPEVFSLLITSYDNTETDGILSKIMTDDPRSAFFQIVDHFWGTEPERGIASTAVIKTGAKLGEDVTVGDGCIISDKTIIGDGTTLGRHVVTIGRVSIGAGCHIQSGVVIGEDGMALVKDNDFLQPIPHYGGVTIGDRVYIGANTCICRGTIEDTVLCDDVKVDQLCHIAHNCVVEEGALLMAGTLLLGGVVIGKGTKVNSALVKEQKVIGDNVLIAHGAVVTRKLPGNVLVRGAPMTVIDRD